MLTSSASKQSTNLFFLLVLMDSSRMICEEPALYPGERDRLRLDCRLRILCKGSRASQNITSVAAKALVGPGLSTKIIHVDIPKPKLRILFGQCQHFSLP